MSIIAHRVFSRVQEGLADMKREIMNKQTSRARVKEKKVGDRVNIKKVMTAGITKKKLQSLYVGPYCTE